MEIKLELLCADVFAPEVFGWDLYGERTDDGFVTLLLQSPDGCFEAESDPDAWSHYNSDATSEDIARLIARAEIFAAALNTGAVKAC